MYVPKSNNIDFWRLNFEYKSSLFKNNESGSWRITENELNPQFKNEKILDVNSNTMIIADTRDFIDVGIRLMINLEILYTFILESHHSNFINHSLKDDNDA